MVSALNSGLRHSHSASLHPDVQMGTGELNAGGTCTCNPAMDYM